MDFKNILESLVARRDLSAEAMQDAIRGILTGAWTPVQTSAFLAAARAKGETPSEIAAAAAVMRELSEKVPLHDLADSAIDTCGTGGDGAGLFNISTASAIVAAAAGARVAKHGNRAASSTSGSADVLAELGVSLDLSPPQIAECIRKIGIGFMFAPNHHPAMKHAVPVRKELGIRTLFNLLGPMTNPAGARRQVVGVFSAHLLPTYIEALIAGGATRAMVVHGGGLDEITIDGDTDIAEWKNGAVVHRAISPPDAGLRTAKLDSLRVGSAAESAEKVRAVLGGDAGAARDIVLLNTAAALQVADLADDFASGVMQAAAAIDSGAGKTKLQELVDATNA